MHKAIRLYTLYEHLFSITSSSSNKSANFNTLETVVGRRWDECADELMYIQNIESLQQRNLFTGDDNDDDHVGQKKAKLKNEGCLGEAEGECWLGLH